MPLCTDHSLSACEQNICCERACKGTECARATSLSSIITDIYEANHIYNVSLGEVSFYTVSSVPNPHALSTQKIRRVSDLLQPSGIR